jgi:hypothetical protein
MAAEIVNLAGQGSGGKDPRLLKAVMDDAGRRVGDFMSKRKITADIGAEYWRNAILSGPKTHLVNALSNSACHAIFKSFERADCWARFGDFLSPVDWRQNAGSRVSWLMRKRHGAGRNCFPMRFGERRYACGEVSRRSRTTQPDLCSRATSDQYNKLEQPYLARDFLGAITIPALMANSFAGKAIGCVRCAFINAPGHHALGGADVLFKFVNERMQLHALAARKPLEGTGSGRRSAPQGRQEAASPTSLIQNPPEDIKMQARNFAAASDTFTGDPPGNDRTKKILAAQVEAADDYE